MKYWAWESVRRWLDVTMRSRSHSYSCVTRYRCLKFCVSAGPVMMSMSSTTFS